MRCGAVRCQLWFNGDDVLLAGSGQNDSSLLRRVSCFNVMANLKADLDEYLSGGSTTSRSGKLSLSGLASSFSLPTLKSPFSSKSGGGGDDQEFLLEEGAQSPNGWFADAQKDCLPSLTKKQRIVGFMICLFMGILCFSLASMYIPLLVVYARKFALLFSLGSLFTLGSFSLLWGPCNHLRHLFSRDRLPFTTVYLVTLLGTLYFAMGMQSTPLTVVAAVGQVVALIWFVVSYIPGGQTGLKFFSKLCSSFCRTTVNRSLPI